MYFVSFEFFCHSLKLTIILSGVEEAVLFREMKLLTRKLHLLFIPIVKIHGKENR